MSVLIQDFQQNFSLYWHFILEGKPILLEDNGKIIAILKPFKENTAMRPHGLAKGLFVVPSDFNAPLPEE